MAAPTTTRPEIWGGIECTVNRVGDRWFNQIEATGHDRRPEDLDLFASLGIQALRYPVLWELHAASPLREPDWHWTDTRLNRLRALAITPIVGLVHHGSGPSHTGLLEESFASGLAAHAGRVAQRFPWLQWYTPVNEPLTTARFSALYGLWYPHARNDRALVRALLNQCRATVLSMQAVRLVNPDARLLQTEDLGWTYSTPVLRYQAEFENERRWLTWDLLCGRMTSELPMYRYLRANGATELELRWFAEHPCPPDILGINHYVTSERFLDEEMQRYPRAYWGGNGEQDYADVEAVRVVQTRRDGWRDVLCEAATRYGLPVAITEAHLGCSREEQLRWLRDAWHAAASAREGGCDVRAVTIWALLGSFDWDSLLTRQSGRYEAGAFDLSAGRPRATALAQYVRELAAGRDTPHAAASGPGWWRRPGRLIFAPPYSSHGEIVLNSSDRLEAPRSAAKPSPLLLIAGGLGNLGQAFARICAHRGLRYRVCVRGDLDIGDSESIAGALDRLRPWAVVNTAGYVRVDEAECNADRCYRENALGPQLLAAECRRRGIAFVTFSSDLVFDGKQQRPYVESDSVSPLNIYGHSKVRAEDDVRASNPDALVIRTSSFFGPWHPHDFLTVALRTLSRGEPFAAMDDITVSPTYVPHLVGATLDLLIDGEKGLWHLANRGSITWAELVKCGAGLAGIDTSRLETRSLASFDLPARRPGFSALGSERGNLMPTLEEALATYIQERVQTAPLTAALAVSQ